VLEGPDPVGPDRVLGVHDHAVLPREQAEAVGVVAAADRAAVVQVEPARDARVDGGDVVVGVVDRPRTVLGDLEVVLPEQLRGGTSLDVVELVDQQHIRVGPLHDLGDRPGLGVVRRGEVSHEVTLGVAVQRGVERREAHLSVVVVPRVVVVGGGCGHRRGEREGGCGEARGEPRGSGDGGHVPDGMPREDAVGE
jgi:hypothetical protein